MKCKYKFQNPEKFDGKPYCMLFNELCKDLSFVCDKNCQVYEDNKQLEKFKKANEKKNEFLKKIGIYATGEFHRIDYYIDKLVAENDRLKRKLKPKIKNAHCAYFEGQTGLCKAKEFTRCNPVNCKLYTIDELSTIIELQEQLDQLKAENEELKKWKETVVGLFERTCRCKYLNEENNHCGFYNRKCIGRLNQCLYKNQQALTEIKEIAENVIKNVSERCIETTPMYGVHKQILQKISEVEDV